MLKRYYLALFPLCILVAACSDNSMLTPESETVKEGGKFVLEPQHNVMIMEGISLVIRQQKSSLMIW